MHDYVFFLLLIIMDQKYDSWLFTVIIHDYALFSRVRPPCMRVSQCVRRAAGGKFIYIYIYIYIYNIQMIYFYTYIRKKNTYRYIFTYA